MPEGPELHLAGRFVNQVCANRTFCGKVVKSAVSLRNPDIPWDTAAYKISATSRGKEVKLTLTETSDDSKKIKTATSKLLSIVFRFGMSGKFKFQPIEDYKVEKHAHLNFFSKDDMVLSFVDYRRFGRWEVTSDWGPDRGPCVILEPELFRKCVLNSLEAAVFKKPICEVLLAQKYFNGIGNYLRAEILYRLSIPPFTEARSVLEPLKNSAEVKREEPDILDLCHQLPNDVVNLSGGKGYIHSPDDPDGHDTFWEWLQCYYKPEMKNMVDHNSRTIWFDGPTGNLVPKDKKSRGRKVVPATKKKRKNEEEVKKDSQDEQAPKRKRSVNTRGKVEKQKSEEETANGRVSRSSCRKTEVKKETPEPEKKKTTRKVAKTATKRVVHENAKEQKKNGKINECNIVELSKNGVKGKKTRGQLQKPKKAAAKKVKTK